MAGGVAGRHRSACTRSCHIGDTHQKAHYFISVLAPQLWSSKKEGRVPTVRENTQARFRKERLEMHRVRYDAHARAVVPGTYHDEDRHLCVPDLASGRRHEFRAERAKRPYESTYSSVQRAPLRQEKEGRQAWSAQKRKLRREVAGVRRC